MNSSLDFDLSSPELVAGERLGVWRLQRPLSEVPSGRWWRATHGVGSQTALVLAYHRREDAGAVLLRMAQAEGQTWEHPDIAWPLDSGLTADGRPYVVMPLLDGEPLLQACRSASLRRRLDWVMQLCELLLLARARGLSLVELDPSLLWVGPQQQLRLHGLALVPAEAGALRMGSLQGQLSGAAQGLHCPHAIRGAPGGEQAQVYAVGMLMCLLVNGRLAHEDALASDNVQLLSQWVSLSSRSRAALDALLRDAVQVDAQRRPADLGELGGLIEAWLEQSGASAGTGAGGLGREESTLAAPADQTPQTPQKPAPRADAPPPDAPSAPSLHDASNQAEPEPANQVAFRTWVFGALTLIALVLVAWLVVLRR